MQLKCRRWLRPHRRTGVAPVSTCKVFPHRLVAANPLGKQRRKAILQSQRQARRLSYGMVPVKSNQKGKHVRPNFSTSSAAPFEIDPLSHDNRRGSGCTFQALWSHIAEGSSRLFKSHAALAWGASAFPSRAWRRRCGFRRLIFQRYG